MRETPKQYEERLLGNLRAACPLVVIAGSWNKAKERWELLGYWKGQAVVNIFSPALNRACDEFRSAYYRAVQYGVIKESK